MVFQQTWDRFKQDWKTFGVMGLGPLLLSLGAGLIMIVIAFVTLGGGVLAMASAAGMGMEPDVTDLFSILGQFMLFFVIALVVGLTVGAMSYAGLVGTVVAYRRGEPVGLGTFWNYATRYWVRFLGLLLLSGLAGLVIQFVLVWIPVLGPLAAVFANLVLSLYLGFYPAYLVITEGQGVLDAMGQSVRGLVRGIGEAALAALVYCLFGLVMILIGLVNVVPLLGQLIWLACILLCMPLMAYYGIERFETNVRPLITQ